MEIEGIGMTFSKFLKKTANQETYVQQNYPAKVKEKNKTFQNKH